MVYSDLKIVSHDTLEKRSYITFYFNGKRIREFNGNSINQNIRPNFASSLEERNKLLKKLEFELQKALEANNYPTVKEQQAPIVLKTTGELLNLALDKKLGSNLSKFYKRNLKSIHKAFKEFLTPTELMEPISNLKRARLESFLSRYNSTGTYYMNKRRDLGVLFSTISRDIEQKLLIVKETDTKKSKAKLHKIYEQEQIRPILDYLQQNHPNLHLCCLLSYGCFLRPHQEVRNLCGHHFRKNVTEVHLAGTENKGGRVRVVYIPDYVRNVLLEKVLALTPLENLFTGSPIPFNDAYFNTAWTRTWLKMYKIGIIQRNQTIYSFRHTAAVNVYRKTKDLNILQQLLGHSDMIVTLKYLRGLGEATNEDLKEMMPEL